MVLKLLGDDSVECVEGYDEEFDLFQDLDLFILGSPANDYKKYTELLQKENSFMDLEKYKSMRLKVLQSFLRIPSIYCTKEFRDKFEDTARNNIKNEIEELKRK